MQNVFMQDTYKPVQYQITPAAQSEINRAGVETESLKDILNQKFQSAAKFKKALSQHIKLTPKKLNIILSSSILEEANSPPEKQ